MVFLQYDTDILPVYEWGFYSLLLKAGLFFVTALSDVYQTKLMLCNF
jgi:hypothetical protein